MIRRLKIVERKPGKPAHGQSKSWILVVRPDKPGFPDIISVYLKAAVRDGAALELTWEE